MNSNLQRLYVQCWHPQQTTIPGCAAVGYLFDKEKFARLIVEECSEKFLPEQKVQMLNHFGFKDEI